MIAYVLKKQDNGCKAQPLVVIQLFHLENHCFLHQSIQIFLDSEQNCQLRHVMQGLVNMIVSQVVHGLSIENFSSPELVIPRRQVWLDLMVWVNEELNEVVHWDEGAAPLGLWMEGSPHAGHNSLISQQVELFKNVAAFIEDAATTLKVTQLESVGPTISGVREKIAMKMVSYRYLHCQRMTAPVESSR